MNQILRYFHSFAIVICCALLPIAANSQVLIINTITGNGTASSTGDGGAALSATINGPNAFALDATNNLLYFAEQNGNRVRVINLSTNIISTVAGTGTSGGTGDGGAATAALLNSPSGLAVDASGNLYIADGGTNRVRMVNPTTGIISLIAGTGSSGFSGDGGQAATAQLNLPRALAFDASGNLYVSDGSNHRVRRINMSTGIITTVAGSSGFGGFGGDGGAAVASRLNNPRGLVFDAGGNLYIGDMSNNRVRRVDAASGIITTVAGIAGFGGFGGDGGPATAARLSSPYGLSIDPANGNLIIADQNNNRIRAIDASGIINTISGTGTAGFLGDGAPASAARINASTATLYDNAGRYYIADRGTNNRIRIVKPNDTPTFENSPMNLAVCRDAAAVSINTLVAVEDEDRNQTLNLSTVMAPSHGIISLGGTAPTTGGTVTFSGQTYTPTTGYSGPDTFAIRIFDGYNESIDTVYVTVETPPATGTISGSSTVCEAASTTLSCSVSAGVWSSSATGVATVGTASGIVSGVAGGTATISYSGSNSCGATATTFVITVNPLPTTPPAISGVTTLCAGGSTSTLSNAVAGGTWSSSNTSVALIGTSGIVTSVAAGDADITYTVTNSCGSAAAVISFSVTPLPVSPDMITGPTDVCEASTITLGNSVPDGVWSSSDGSVCTVGTAGIVTGVSGGIATISYTIANSCGSNSSTQDINVTALPVIPSAISGITTVCAGGATTSLSNAVTGGTWISTNAAVATVDATGEVTGVNAGTTTISYTNANICGSQSVSTIVTVNPLPATPTAIAGTAVFCSGTSTTLSNGVAGGAWSSSNTGVASVGPTGIVQGVSAGNATISYTITNSCGTLHAVATVTVSPLPVTPGAITGTPSVCPSLTVSLSNATAGGIWSSTNTTVATINSSGVVTGVIAGTTTISYTITNSCGSNASSTIFTVNSLPSVASISGSPSVCHGSSTSFTNATSGGAWSSSNTSIASVNGSGVVFGIAPGTATITYTFTNTCGSVNTTAPILVNPISTAAPISGIATVCPGANTVLANTTPGGAWSSSTMTVATVGPTGIVRGVSAGTTTITYSVTTSCGAATSTRVLTVNPLPTAPSAIIGTASFCGTGGTTTLSNATAGGRWVSSNSSIASVGSSSGIVTAIGAGTATISYNMTNSCGTASALTTATVNTFALPFTGTIVGTTYICAGLSTIYTNSVTGGVWSTTTGNASISTTGALNALTPGIDTILYTVTNACGSAAARRIITVGAFHTAGTISGTSVFCAGTSSSLSSSVGAGVWSSGSALVATVTSAGMVTGLSGGTASISYSVWSACGTAHSIRVVTVNPLPNPGIISGPSNLCSGSTTTYTNWSTGGTWSSSDPSVATVASSTGAVTPLAPGTVVITYAITNACGTTSTTKSITVGAFLSPGVISGLTDVCVGNTITLSNTVLGGTWSNTSGNATVTSGVVTGVTTGSELISYTVTGSCGSAVATYLVNINPLPVAGSISGASLVCVGSTITMSATLSGGVWGSVYGNATVSTSGIATGATAGIDTITYSIGNSCGVATATAGVVVDAIPSAGVVSGASTVCEGAVTTLSSTAVGGTWSSSGAGATVAGGLVTGVSASTVTISYTTTSVCGSDVATFNITVLPLPDAGTITGPAVICLGSTATFSSTVAGGSWSVTGTAASITTAGIASGDNLGAGAIIYETMNSCGTDVSVFPVSVQTTPVAGSLAGPATVCQGATAVFTSTAAGGIWSTASTAIATIDGAGTITGVAGGSTTISYTVTTACGTSTTSTPLTVNPLPIAGTVSGPGTLCVGSTGTVTSSVAGGTWSTAFTGITLGSGGSITATSDGVAIITYTTTNSCGSSVALYSLTVLPLPNAGSLIGAGSVCPGSSVTITATVSGGIWSAAGSRISVVGGVVTGITSGNDTVLYTVTNSCGSARARQPILVNPNTAGTITGPTSVCAGSSVTLGNAVTGGVWTITNPRASLTIISGGVRITGITGGMDTVVYTVTGVCGVSVTSRPISIQSLPNAGLITGASSVCPGSVTTLVNGVTGGAWTSSNTAIATVATSGVLTAIAPGWVNIGYSVTNACGSAVANFAVTIKPWEDCTPSQVAPLGNQQPTLAVFPNPNNGTFQVRVTTAQDEPAHITLTNVAGEKVYELTTTTNKLAEVQLPVASGVYFLSATTATGRQVTTVTVNR